MLLSCMLKISLLLDEPYIETVKDKLGILGTKEKTMETMFCYKVVKQERLPTLADTCNSEHLIPILQSITVTE